MVPLIPSPASNSVPLTPEASQTARSGGAQGGGVGKAGEVVQGGNDEHGA